MREQYHSKWRLTLVLMVLFVLFSVVLVRLYYVCITDRQFLLKQSNNRILRQQIIPAYRGMIMDRTGVPLAISTPLDSVWVNPSQYKANENQSQQLAALLQLDAKSMRAKIQSSLLAGKEFLYLRRMNAPSVGALVEPTLSKTFFAVLSAINFGFSISL